MQLVGVILAGGRGSRAGGADKALLMLGDRPLLVHVAERLSPQVAALALNANGAADRFATPGLARSGIADVLADARADFSGPLAGILAGLDWAAGLGADAMVSVAVDTPFFPADLVARLQLARETTGQPVALAESGSGLHPTFGVWPVAGRGGLRAALESGTRRVTEWAEALGWVQVSFPGSDPDPFFNINTLADLAAAEALFGSRA